MRHRPSSGDPVVDVVVHTANHIRDGANSVLAECGLSLWTFKTLKTLDQLGPSRSVDLGEVLGIAPRTVTGAIDALEAEGLVERRPHPTDRRAHLLVVTDLGRERLTEAKAVHSRYIARGQVLTAAEREQLLALMQRLDAAFGVCDVLDDGSAAGASDPAPAPA